MTGARANVAVRTPFLFPIQKRLEESKFPLALMRVLSCTKFFEERHAMIGPKCGLTSRGESGNVCGAATTRGEFRNVLAPAAVVRRDESNAATIGGHHATAS